MAVLLLTACESPKELGVVPYPQYAQTTSKTVELPSTVTFSTNLAKSDMNDLLAYLPPGGCVRRYWGIYRRIYRLYAAKRR